jgi:CBS domain containing-hemolysin-like protein
MNWLIVAVGLLVVLGSVLAMAETSISRMNRVRAHTLREDGRRNAALLVRIQEDPARYLNSVYLSVMFAQNGSAILVAFVADRELGSVGITLISAGFTVLYFVLVEAMAKTFGILHSDRAALMLSPFVFFLSRVLSYPTRALIGLANALLPGKGLKHGPFVEEEIRTMADLGHEEGAIEKDEKEMIHSVFEFGDTVVREVMVPRPDMVGVPMGTALKDVLGLMLENGFSRMPVFEEDDQNRIVGLVYAKDVMRQLHPRKARSGNGKRTQRTLKDVLRKAAFVPESKKVSELLREMQASATHMAIVVDEYGDVDGLVTLEDLLEEIVGEIADEYDREEPQVQPIDAETLLVNGRFPVDELSELLNVDLPNSEWDTVGGLMAGLLGQVPKRGQEVTFQGLRFRADRVQGQRIKKVLVMKAVDDNPASATN